MVFSYYDNGDLCIVIKDAQAALKDKQVRELVSSLLLEGSKTPSDELGDDDDLSEITNIPDAELLPEEVIIDSDEEFKAVAADFRSGRFNGELRAHVAEKLNSWLSRFKMTEQKQEEFISFMGDKDTDRFLMNYDSIITPDKKEWITKIEKKPSYDLFVLNGSVAAKKQLIREVLKRFQIKN